MNLILKVELQFFSIVNKGNDVERTSSRPLSRFSSSRAKASSSHRKSLLRPSSSANSA